MSKLISYEIPGGFIHHMPGVQLEPMAVVNLWPRKLAITRSMMFFSHGHKGNSALQMPLPPHVPAHMALIPVIERWGNVITNLAATFTAEDTRYAATGLIFPSAEMHDTAFRRLTHILLAVSDAKTTIAQTTLGRYHEITQRECLARTVGMLGQTHNSIRDGLDEQETTPC